jgi:hypothetical protein
MATAHATTVAPTAAATTLTRTAKTWRLSDYPAVVRFAGSVLPDAVDDATTADLAAALAAVAAHAAVEAADATVDELRAHFAESLADDVYARADLATCEPAVLEAVTCIVDELAWDTTPSEFARVLDVCARMAAGVNRAAS